jgi:hypothetical protein
MRSRFLPDGRHFLFYAGGEPDSRGVYWADLESKDYARLFDSDSAAVYSPSGHLLFIRQSTLFAQRFDAPRRQLLGDLFAVAEQAALDVPFNAGAISAGTGVLAYRTGGSSGNRQLVWVDRSGKPLGGAIPRDEFSTLNLESYRRMAAVWQSIASFAETVTCLYWNRHVLPQCD